MLAEVKKCADRRDIKGLRYIFVDCLDVDPTFEKYKVDYEYCKKIPGMFDAHQELNELVENEKLWDKKYWEQLKIDLMKNFSEKRFEHMITVAKVVYADKIARLISERKEKQSNSRQQNEKRILEKDTRAKENIENVATKVVSSNTDYSKEDKQRSGLEKTNMEKEANNKAAEEERCNRQSRVEDGIKAPQQQRNNESDFLIKKVLRVVLVVAVIVVILVVFSLQGNNPQ